MAHCIACACVLSVGTLHVPYARASSCINIVLSQTLTKQAVAGQAQQMEMPAAQQGWRQQGYTGASTGCFCPRATP